MPDSQGRVDVSANFMHAHGQTQWKHIFAAMTHMTFIIKTSDQSKTSNQRLFYVVFPKLMSKFNF